jgi:hypothetical protein
VKATHLVRRFLRSLVAKSPTAEEDAWVASVLTPGELALWRRLPRYDRRHTLGVAREVGAVLGDAQADTRWVGAALLHDIGKLEAGLGLIGRVMATLGMLVVGRRRMIPWAGRRGWRGRFGRYADHGRIGGRLIREAGGREEVAVWAEHHHEGNERPDGAVPGVPDRAVRALVAADRD